MEKTHHRGLAWGAGALLALALAPAACGESSGSGSPGSKGGEGGAPEAVAAGSPGTGAATSMAGTQSGHAGSLGDAGSSQDVGGAGPGGAGAPSETGGAAGETGGAPGEAGGAPGDAAGSPSDAGEGPGPMACKDLDGDGFHEGVGCPTQLDCDDQNPLVNPGMLELADDGVDNDCAGGELTASAGPGYYVDGSNGACSDGNDAVGTKAKPYCSIAIAVVRSYQATDVADPVGRSLFVAKGTYPVTTGTPKSMRIYGGYDASDWSYDPAKNVTVLGGADAMKDADGYLISTSWISLNVKANVVLQGFHIQGGKRAGAPIFAVEVHSSGKIELYDNTIVAGEGVQTLAVQIESEVKQDPTSSNVWLIKNRISAGKPETSSNYAVNNLGTAVLWGNVIDMGQGAPSSFGAAVQNYGTMYLVNNVLNGGDYGGAVDSSYGFINSKADGLPDPGVGYAYNNVIFGGHGSNYSVGVRNDAILTLYNNVLGDRVPGPLALAEAPSTLATGLASGFAAQTTLVHNDFYQLVYSDEATPQDAAAKRHLMQYSDQQAHVLDDAADINACNWTGCQSATAGNLVLAPGFTSDFHLTPGSALHSEGHGPAKTSAFGLVNIDIDGELRPKDAWDIGIDE